MSPRPPPETRLRLRQRHQYWESFEALYSLCYFPSFRPDQETSCALTEISALKSLETGQPVSAAFTAASNLALSAPGIFATRSRWLLVILKPSPTFSSEMVHVVSSLLAVMPAPPSCAERAIVKQPAWAA